MKKGPKILKVETLEVEAYFSGKWRIGVGIAGLRNPLYRNMLRHVEKPKSDIESDKIRHVGARLTPALPPNFARSWEAPNARFHSLDSRHWTA